MTLKSKINGIELGDHLCLVYDNEKDKLYTTILFIIDGLKKEELVFVLNEDEEEIIRILGEIIDVRRFIEKEQLIFLSKEEIYLKDGFFDANKMLETIAELDEKALIEGYKGLRVVRNANWILTHPKLESFLEFEAKLNKLLPLTKSIFLCLFDERKFNPGLLLRILQVHPKLISGKEVRENLNYLPPDKFLKKLKAGNATLKKLIDRKLMIEFEEMEEKFRMLFESSFEAVMIFKGDRLIACNPKAIELFGFKDFQQLLGKRIYDLFKENSLEYRVNAASRGEPQFFELGFFRTDGDKIDLEVSLTKVSDKLMMIARDITERKKMEEELREREERYRLLVDSSIDAIITINSKAEILTWNRGAEKIFGYRAEEVIGKPLTILIPERFRERFRKRFNQIYSVFKSEFEYPIGRYMETIGLRKNGEEFPAEMSYYIWRSGDKIFFTSIVRDISERNRLEQSLRESEKKYRELWENAGDVLFIIDLEGNFLEANRTARELFGYNKEEVKKLNLRDVVDENYLPVIYQEIEKIINSKRSEILNLEVLCYTKDGKAVWMESRAKPIIDKGRIIAIQGIARDITERKKMEEAIKESEEKFRALAEKSLVGIYLIQDGVFKYVNPKMAELWGYSVDELIGRNPLEFIHPEDKEIVKRNIEKRIKGETDSIHYRLRMVRKDGSIRINEVYGSRTFYSGKPAVLGTLVDITDEERRRKKLEEYKRFYQNAQDLFFILDGKGRFVDINPKYAEMLGYSKEELIGHTARKLIDPDELDKVRENFKKVMRGQSVRYEAKAVAKDGRVYVMDVTIWPVFNKGKVVGAEGILRDVTEYIRLNKLLNAINNINKIIVREKDRLKLINKASNELMALGYFTCWIGIRDGDNLITTSDILKTLELKDYRTKDKKNANCVIKAMENKTISFREGDNIECSRCEFYEKHKGLKRYAIPMIVDGEDKGGIVVYSAVNLPEDEIDLLKILANDLAFAIKSIEVENEKLRALEQIEKNIENYAILIDHIRNPLAIISGIAETKLDKDGFEEEKEIIMKSVEKIEDVVERLDRGWLESEEIRKFLRRGLNERRS